MAKIKLKYVNGFANHDRKNGQRRYYFRRRGFPTIPLPGLPGSDDFIAAYSAALAMIPNATTEIGADRTLPGTINALAVAHYKSDEWLNSLTEDTRKSRRRIIERFRAKNGDKRVALLRHEHILIMLSEITKPSIKRHWLNAIRGLMKSAIPMMRKDDPTAGITIKLPKSKGHHDWADAEIARYRSYWPLGTQQRLVMEFALEAMSRRGEVVRLGPQHVQKGRIRIARTHGSRDVDIPMPPELQAACDAMPKRHLTYIVTAQGNSRAKSGLGKDFAKWATEAGLPKRCRLHGLKKAGMRRLAEDGATARTRAPGWTGAAPPRRSTADKLTRSAHA